MLRRVLGVSLPLALTLALTGCSGTVDSDKIRSAEGGITGVTVSGEPGTAPTVRIAAPLEKVATRSETVVAGTGAPVVVDQLFVLELTIYDARTGKKAISTYDAGQRAMAVKDTDGTLFPALSTAIVGVRQGGRLVMSLAPEDGYGDAGAPQYGIDGGDPLVVVADVIAVPPTETLPSAGPAPGALPRSFFAGSKPDRLTVSYRIEGDGPAIRKGSLVTLRSFAQVWGARDPFDDSYGKEPALVPIGTGTVVAAWDKALVGVRRGSRIVIIAPPRFAFGTTGSPPSVPPDATIVYVIDVLGVS